MAHCYFSLFSSPSNEDSSCNESCPTSDGAIEPALPGLINRDDDGIIPRLKCNQYIRLFILKRKIDILNTKMVKYKIPQFFILKGYNLIGFPSL